MTPWDMVCFCIHRPFVHILQFSDPLWRSFLYDSIVYSLLYVREVISLIQISCVDKGWLLYKRPLPHDLNSSQIGLYHPWSENRVMCATPLQGVKNTNTLTQNNKQLRCFNYL